ncbi:MAG: hypothetical protein GX345_07765 [Clostridiales bacterium]|nr:hypothetical protein [Clostridiales bacterium]
MAKYLLGIDIGGGSLKSILFSVENKTTTLTSKKMPSSGIFKIGEFGYGLGTQAILQAIKELIAESLAQVGANASDLKGLSFSSLRHTLVALGQEGEVLFASPNRDARAVDQTMRLIDDGAEKIYSISGHRPMPNLMACKLQWLRDNNNELYSKIKTAFTLADYINYKLTGEIYAERTNAAESMLFDLFQNTWSQELIGLMGLESSYLPKIIDSGTPLGKISADAAETFGLSSDTVLVAGAGDTQSALLGMCVTQDGAVGVVAGTTTPIQMQTGAPIIDKEGRTWTGAAALPGKFVIESNGGGMGIALEWAAGLLFAEYPQPVAALLAHASKMNEGAGGVVSTVGAQVFNNSVLSLPIDQLMFSTTNYIPNETDRARVSRAVLEGMAFAVNANLEQIKEVAAAEITKLNVAGGLSRSDDFSDIIANVSGEKVFNPSLFEASAFGACVCAAMALGEHGSLEEATLAMALPNKAFENESGSYERIYDEWRETYSALFDVTMPLGALINELRSDLDQSTSGASEESATKLRIYSDADLSEESIELLKKFGDVTAKNYRDGDMLEGDEMIETLKDYDVFITEVDIVDAAIIKELPNLRMIGVCRGNPTNVDIDACTSAGIPLVYTPGRNAEAVADLTLGLMINAVRMITQSADFLKEEGEAGDMGRMGAAYFRYQGLELWNQKVGLIGAGAIGKKVARRLRGFDAHVLVYDPYLSFEDAALMGAQKVELDELLAQSAIVSLHAPVTEETKGMIGAEEFEKMKQGAYFVNTARAALVDYKALLKALESGKLAAAALDVFPEEPPASDDPLVNMENVIATPHIAGNSKQVSIHQGMIMAENIEKLLRGEMGPDVINRQELKSFSFSGEKEVDEDALERLMGNVVGVSDLDAGKQEEKSATPAKQKESQPVAVETATAQSGPYAVYMRLIEVFLNKLSSDKQVRDKTKSKDISFQITFRDNEQSCYMYFNKGDIDAALGLFPGGDAEVNLRMPIEIFDGMMRGTVNGANAAMTGKMSFTGNVRKAMSMQSILKLMMNSYTAAIDEVGDIDISKLGQTQAAAPQGQAAQGVASGAYSQYMNLIEEFLAILVDDTEVREKTKNKDISFQITFKDNDEPCYMYFNKGDIDAALGLFPGGEAEVNLRMPIEIFDGMMRGTVNGANAAMTGKMSFTGNVRKAMSMQSILKLMMGAYERALEKVGDIDVTTLGQAESVEEVSAPQSPAEVQAQAAASPAVPAAKGGFLSKIFGKKAPSTPLEAQSIQTVEKVVYVGKDEKPKTNDVRDQILQVTTELYEKGLITGIGGNISARCEDNPNHVWITPSSVFKGDLRADMMVRIDLDGNTVGDTELSASSEKMVHLAIYKRRPEIMSVVHSHAPKATIMALAGLKFLPISTDAAFIGDIPVVPFVIPGSPELGDMVGEAIGEEGAAVLMQNHGLVVAGASCRRAADNTEVVEATAEKLLECAALGIEPVLLPDEAIEELAEIGKMLV